MEKKMKTVSILMSLFMGVTLSFCLSLLGNLLAEGGFKPIVFIVSFIVPMRKISTAITKNMKPRSIGAKLVDALVSDLIYTPVITLVMIVLVRFMANKMSGGHAQLPPFAVMFLSSLVISLVAAFVIILIVTPLFMMLSLKLAGVPAGGPPSGRRE